MSEPAPKYGSVTDLGVALGLFDEAGTLKETWFQDPAASLKDILGNESQRTALVRFLDDVLGGEEREQTGDLTWLLIFNHPDPDLGVYWVLNAEPETEVHLGLGLRVETAPSGAAPTTPQSRTEVHVPLFRVAKGTGSVGNPLLLGTPEGAIHLSARLTLDSTTPRPGEAHLGGFALEVEIPTAEDSSGHYQPNVALELIDQQFPGATRPQTLRLSIKDWDELGDSAIELVLGLVRAQAEAASGAAAPLAGLAGLLGLTGAVPPFPIAELIEQGPEAIARWFRGIMGETGLRDTFLEELSKLFGDAASFADGQIEITYGSATIALGADVRTNGGGQPVIAPRLSVAAEERVDGVPIEARAEATLFSVDLGTGQVVALPALQLFGRLGQAASPLLSGDVRVAALRVGVGLNEDQKPVFVLGAEGVTFTDNQFDYLDLSSAEALANSAGTVLSGVAASLLDELGPVGPVLKPLLGIEPPSSAVGLTAIDFPTFFQDPLRALRTYWRSLLSDHPATVTELLGSISELVRDGGTAALITGDGSADAPWEVPLVDRVVLSVFHDGTGGQLTIGLAAQYFQDALGHGCTRLDARLNVALARFNLVEPDAEFLPLLRASLTGRARGQTRAVLELDPVRISADHFGLALDWSPQAGLSLRLAAPHLRAGIEETEIPVVLPEINATGGVDLDEAAWLGVQNLIGVLGTLSPLTRNWVEALGWAPRDGDADGDNEGRLDLAALIADPQGELLEFGSELLLGEARALEQLITGVARLLTGSDSSLGDFLGSGHPEDPFGLPLGPAGGAALTLWSEPFGTLGRAVTVATDEVRGWRPGQTGLSSAQLVEALTQEASGARDLAPLLAGRSNLAAGFEALISRFAGTDGLVIPPETAPGGAELHALVDVPARDLKSRVDLTALVGEATVTLHVGVAAPGSRAFPDAPPDRHVDLTAAGLAPESFALPAAESGEWFVSLGTRAAARLASGDPDGSVGQAARLGRVVAALSAPASGSVTVVGHGKAGHAAEAAAQQTPGVSAVVLLGTPKTPVAFSVLSLPPGAEALRLLRWLLPAGEADEDPDLRLARNLVTDLLALLNESDPSADYQPPSFTPAVRADLPVHLVYGTLSEEALRRALSAVVVSGLATRATQRDETQGPSRVDAARGGFTLPVRLIGTEVSLLGEVRLDLFGVRADAPLALDTQRALIVRLELRRTNGWLVGGPDSDLPHELRFLEARFSVPLGGTGQVEAELVLHEPRVFGLQRERWTIRQAGGTTTADEVVTPALPEVGTLLAHLAEALATAAATDPTATNVLDLCRAFALLGETQGFNIEAITHLLAEPRAHLRELASSQGASLQAAVLALFPQIPALGIDLASERLALHIDQTTSGLGLFPWTVALSAGFDGSAEFRLTMGTGEAGQAGGAQLVFESASRRLWLDVLTPGGASTERLSLWPLETETLETHLPRLLLSEVGRMGLEFARRLDPTAQPLIDALLAALGLLGPVRGPGTGLTPQPERNVRPLLGLFTDPVAWFLGPEALGGASGFGAERVVTFLQALAPIVGLPAVGVDQPGHFQLARGVVLRADEDGGQARLGIDVDSSAFAQPGDALARLTLGLGLGLTLKPDRPPAPSLDLAVGLPDGEAGRRALHVQLADPIAVFLRPASGSDISLYPDPPGLGQIAEAGVSLALPFVLNALAEETGANAAGTAGEVVRTAGRVLGLLQTGTTQFDETALRAWTANPALQLQQRLPAIATSAAAELAHALDPFLPSFISASVGPSGALPTQQDTLLITVGPVSASLNLSSVEFGIQVTALDVPGVERIALDVLVSAAGIDRLTLDVGPMAIDLEGATLRPLVSLAVGNAPPGGSHLAVGLGLGESGERSLVAHFGFQPPLVEVRSRSAGTSSVAPEDIARDLLLAVAELVGSVVLQTDAVSELLALSIPRAVPPGPGDRPLGALREVLAGVLLAIPAAAGAPDRLDPSLFDGVPTTSGLLMRFKTLLGNLAAQEPGVQLDPHLSLFLSAEDLSLVDGDGIARELSVLGLGLGITGRSPLNPGDDVVISIEADSRWIEGQPTGGVRIFLFDLSGGPEDLTFTPGLSVDGVGVRISKDNGPLLDVGLSVGSVALHLFGRVLSDTSGNVSLAGGVQVQLSEMAVSLAGAGGTNAVAQGLVADTGGGDTPPPAFSPALAIQKHGGSDVQVSLRAGDGPGPWWLSIEQAFGPLYLGQIGFGSESVDGQLRSVTLYLDGGVSIAGLSAFVDELSISATAAGGLSLLDGSDWSVDLKGLAISADLAGVSLAGGLLKNESELGTEYLGMLSAKFATYGLSVFGGYGEGTDTQGKFSSFFVFGAILGPIGGPPAFFITGIGGGLGINRDLKLPRDFDALATDVMLNALDPKPRETPSPMELLYKMRENFGMKRGQFWFAAGISFNSFALVDGIAVLAVSFGDGLEIAILGLARLLLPDSNFTLVSIELGLIVRFSTKEGVIWVQAQLTDNSWLLDKSVRLTGGFAFVVWFDGPHRGHCVVTLGGYHPSFFIEYYPVVPRLGFCWKLDDAITIKGETYFALTSEAIMAGGRLEISVVLGPAWAQLIVGADGIVYYDPFRFEVEVYASISAGVTIDLFFGEITLSFTLGASILLRGPDFSGRATLELGPISLTVEFGDQQSTADPLPWASFVPKYLEEVEVGVARALSAVTGKGTKPPAHDGAEDGSAENASTADGSAERPFVVFCEFELTLVSTIPLTAVTVAGVTTNEPLIGQLGLAPVGIASIETPVTIALHDASGANFSSKLRRQSSRKPGAFPVGVWGPSGDEHDKKLPQGETIMATDGVHFKLEATVSEGTDPIRFDRVEVIEPHKELPFFASRGGRTELLLEAKQAQASLLDLGDRISRDVLADDLRSLAGRKSSSLRRLRADEVSPPMISTLVTELADRETAVAVERVALDLSPPPEPELTPRALALLGAPVLTESQPRRTTVKAQAGVPVIAPPTLAAVEASLPRNVAAKLLLVRAPGAETDAGLVTAGRVPTTRLGQAKRSSVRRRGAARSGLTLLDEFERGLTSHEARLTLDPVPLTHVAPPVLRADFRGAKLASGEVVILQLPRQKRRPTSSESRPTLLLRGGSARVVLMARGGTVLSDEWIDASTSAVPVLIPGQAERIAVLHPAASDPPRYVGFHSGQELPYLGHGRVAAAGAVVNCDGGETQLSPGWLEVPRLLRHARVVTTTFAHPISSLAVALDETQGRVDGLALELLRATRPQDASGQDRPPLLLSVGHRSYLIYDIITERDEQGQARSPAIAIARSDTWRIFGVLGAPVSAEQLLREISARGLEGLLASNRAARTISSLELTWHLPAGDRPLTPTGTDHD